MDIHKYIMKIGSNSCTRKTLFAKEWTMKMSEKISKQNCNANHTEIKNKQVKKKKKLESKVLN